MQSIQGMVTSLNISRRILYILTLVITLIGVGFIADAVMTSGWQIMREVGGTAEIHQHGLWLDYVFMRPHGVNVISQSDGFSISSNLDWGGGVPTSDHKWIMTYKFGDAVIGSEVHMAMPYQINTLVLLCLTIILSLVASVISYCAGMNVCVTITWAAMLFFAFIFSSAALIQFFVACMLPEYRFTYTDRRMEQVVGYSFYRAVVGVVCLMIATAMSIACAVLLVMKNRKKNNSPKPIKATRPVIVQQETSRPVYIITEPKNGTTKSANPGRGNGGKVSPEKSHSPGHESTMFAQMDLYNGDNPRLKASKQQTQQKSILIVGRESPI